MKIITLVLFTLFITFSSSSMYIEQKKASYDALEIRGIQEDEVLIPVGTQDFNPIEHVKSSEGELTVDLSSDDLTILQGITAVYTITDSYGQSKEVCLQFRVVDEIAPTLTLKKQELTIPYGKNTESVLRENIESVIDNYDSDLNVEIEYNPKDKKANYRVVDSSKNQTVLEIKVSEEGPPIVVIPNIEQPSTSQGVKPTFINGTLLVNKRYAIPASYISPQKDEAYAALQQMLAAASQSGHSMPILSGYRSYSYQQSLFQRYVNSHGLATAETFSARAGHSEHQTGLAYDIGVLSSDFANTAAYGWLQENAASFGFVERYPSGKTHITGYIFEPWHYRYVGVSHALAIKASGLTLEEYLGVA